MAKPEVKIYMSGDNTSFDKALENSVKRLERTRKSTKKSEKEVNDLGNAFSQTANQVTIFNGQLDPISGRLSAIGTGINRFGAGNIALAASVGATTLAIKSLMAASVAYEKRQLRFNALLKATSYQSKLTARDLEDLANQIGMDTLSNTEEAAEGINALLTFKQVQGDIFKETVKLARDAQVAFGGNLREGVVAFGKALNDPVSNLGALSRKGIQFTDVQTEMIKNFWETGDAAKAQNIIIQEMRDQFGGLAEQEAKTLEGTFDSLAHTTDRFVESLGKSKPIRNLIKSTDLAVKQLIKTLELADHQQLKSNKKLEEDYQTSLKLNAVKKEQYQAELKLQQLNEKNDGRELNRKEALELERAKENLDFITNTKLPKIQEAYDYHFGYRELQEQNLTKKEKIANKIRLEAEKEANQKRFNEAVKAGEKLQVAISSRYDNQRDKAKRQHSDDLETIEKQYQAEYLAAEKAGKSLLIVEEKYADLREDVEYGFHKKLKDIDRVEQQREAAKANRIKRANEKQANALKKQQKFINEILNGNSKLAALETDYQEDVTKLQSAEFQKTLIVTEQYQTREQMVQALLEKRKNTYDDDVQAYKEALASKEQADLERAAKNAGKRFQSDIQLGFSEISSNRNFAQELFDIDDTNEQLEMVESTMQAHFDKISQMGLSSWEEEARYREIYNKSAVQQEKIKSKSIQDTTANMWNAVSTLGASGSKKLFVMAKAANIAQATMSTITAATNAYRDVPYPFNIAAAATIGAAGYVNVRNIVNQPMPQFHDGIDYVPREGTYLLDQGERVLDSRLNSDLKTYLNDKDGGSGSQPVSINLTLPDTGNYNATEQWFNNNADVIVEYVKYAMNRP